MNSNINPSLNGHNSPKSETKIGVIGAGVVGGALLSYFDAQGRPTVAYDKFKPAATLEELNEASIIFVCVPTPYHEELGLDPRAVEESIARLEGEKTVVIKSTVLPGTTDRIAAAFPQHHVMFNPEFLREKTAFEDFLNPDRQVVGITQQRDTLLARMVLDLLPPAPHEAVLPATACEMIKVATNSFLALKVTFANEIFDLCSALNIDYEAVKAGLYADARIGASHFDIFDGGYRGFGGKCLPKDSLGLLDMAERIDTPVQLLRAAQRVNEKLLEAAVDLADAA